MRAMSAIHTLIFTFGAHVVLLKGQLPTVSIKFRNTIMTVHLRGSRIYGLKYIVAGVKQMNGQGLVLGYTCV